MEKERREQRKEVAQINKHELCFTSALPLEYFPQFIDRLPAAFPKPLYPSTTFKTRYI